MTVRPRVLMLIALTLGHVAGSSNAADAGGGTAPQFSSADKWEHAGYNLDEIIYTVFITNHDTRILRCRTEIHAVSINNGQKATIADLQVTTVFPDKEAQAGIWSGLDEPSGATYTVNCRAL